MKSLLRTIPAGIAAITLSVSSASALELQQGDRVLFIGNSLTGSNDGGVPGFANAALASVGGPQMQFDRIQIWAQTLRTHWEIAPGNDKWRFRRDGSFRGESTLLGTGQYTAEVYAARGYVRALEAIEQGDAEGSPWKYVVLQGYDHGRQTGDTHPANRIIRAKGEPPVYEGDFFTFGTRFIEAVRGKGAEPVLYMRTYNNPADYQDRMDAWKEAANRLESNYRVFARHHGVPLVPVGEVVHSLSLQKPDPTLPDGWLYSDGIHPNDFGRAVWGYTFAAVFIEANPVAMSIEHGNYRIGAVEETTGFEITPELDAAIKERTRQVLARYYAWARK